MGRDEVVSSPIFPIPSNAIPLAVGQDAKVLTVPFLYESPEGLIARPEILAQVSNGSLQAITEVGIITQLVINAGKSLIKLRYIDMGRRTCPAGLRREGIGSIC
jgi:hypothetical protein